MNTIHKFPLAMHFDAQTVELPVSAKVIHVGSQNNEVVMWVVLDPKSKKVKRKFVIYATGQTMVEPSLKHVGTVQVRAFVWHVFEI